MKTRKEIEEELKAKERRVGFWERTHNILTYSTTHPATENLAEAGT